MKRFLWAFISLVAVFLACCSNDDSSSSVSGEENKNSGYTVQDSATVLAYTFSRFLSDSDVKIVDEDTSRLSVDTAFANRIEEGLPSVANVIAVWDKITNFPFYVRVRNVQEKNGRLLIDVDKATVYDAMPNGKFEFSSELFFDPSKVNENDEEIPPEAFYDEEKGIYHPMVLIPYNPESGSENDDDEVESVDKSDNQLVALAKENGYIDMRELVKSNWTGRFDETIFDINVDLHPGLLTIPGMGMELGDYQGSWLKLFGGMDKLQAAFAKENGFNPATTKGDGKTQQANPWTVVKAYVRVDTISYKLKTDFHLLFQVEWMVPQFFQCYFNINSSAYISDIGVGLGSGVSGEKRLTQFQGWNVVFSIGPIPISIVIAPNLYFKYNVQAYGLVDWRMQYKYTKVSQFGVRWEKGIGASKIEKISKDETKKNPFDLEHVDIIFTGKASAGLILRMSALLYGTAGPTVGTGVRLDLESQIGMSEQYDENGNKTGIGPKSGHVKLDAAIPLELGAEVKIGPWTLFSRAWDVTDLKNFNIFNYSFGEDKK